MASSDRGAGIGGGIGYGYGGSGGQFTVNGNAVVFAISNQAAHIGGSSGGSEGTKKLNQGVVFEGSNGTVHGSPELPGDITIPDGSTLTVPNGSTLTVPDGTTVMNNGTITNSGTINDFSGSINGSVNGNPINNKASETAITFWKDGQKLTDGKAVYGDTVTVQVAVAQKNTRLRTAAPDQVIFRAGTTELGTETVTNGTASFSLPLTGDSWKPDSYTITAA
ncbi:hypothetical protein, partial [Eisenbergiella sp. OF01-20]